MIAAGLIPNINEVEEAEEGNKASTAIVKRKRKEKKDKVTNENEVKQNAGVSDSK
jgi:hypothetical protein